MGKTLVIYNKKDNSIWGYIFVSNPDDVKHYPPDPKTQIALPLDGDHPARFTQDNWHVKNGKLISKQTGKEFTRSNNGSK